MYLWVKFLEREVTTRKGRSGSVHSETLILLTLLSARAFDRDDSTEQADDVAVFTHQALSVDWRGFSQYVPEAERGQAVAVPCWWAAPRDKPVFSS